MVTLVLWMKLSSASFRSYKPRSQFNMHYHKNAWYSIFTSAIGPILDLCTRFLHQFPTVAGWNMALLYMTNTGNQTQDLLILSPSSYGHVFPLTCIVDLHDRKWHSLSSPKHSISSAHGSSASAQRSSPYSDPQRLNMKTLYTVDLLH